MIISGLTAQLERTHKLFMADFGPAFGGRPAGEPQSHGRADLGGGDYAALDRLLERDPAAYEAALARMSPAERDRYGF